MSVRTFRCSNPACYRYREKVPLDAKFFCKREECRGNRIQENREIKEEGWFVVHQKSAIICGLVLVLLILLLALRPGRATPRPALSPSAATQAPLVSSAPPAPINRQAAISDSSYAIDSIIASSQNLLRLWRAKLIAEDTADTKAINGRRVTAAGRTTEEALDRVKDTYEQGMIFSEVARQKEGEILTETSRYLELLRHLQSFQTREVEEELDSLTGSGLNRSARNEMALGLVKKHFQQGHSKPVTMDDVATDFQQSALR